MSQRWNKYPTYNVSFSLGKNRFTKELFLRDTDNTYDSTFGMCNDESYSGHNMLDFLILYSIIS